MSNCTENYWKESHSFWSISYLQLHYLWICILLLCCEISEVQVCVFFTKEYPQDVHHYWCLKEQFIVRVDIWNVLLLDGHVMQMPCVVPATSKGSSCSGSCCPNLEQVSSKTRGWACKKHELRLIRHLLKLRIAKQLDDTLVTDNNWLAIH